MREPTTRVIRMRVTDAEYFKIKFLADTYANKNMSLLLLHSVLNFPRQFLTKKALENSKRINRT
jgi:hypothetical protein